MEEFLSLRYLLLVVSWGGGGVPMGMGLTLKIFSEDSQWFHVTLVWSSKEQCRVFQCIPFCPV